MLCLSFLIASMGADVRDDNAKLLAFGVSAADRSGVSLPMELKRFDTYWLGKEPVTRWSAESRRLAFDRFLEVSRTDSNVRDWLLAADTMSGLELEYRLVMVVDVVQRHSSHGKAFTLMNEETYAYDYSAIAQFVSGLRSSSDDLVKNGWSIPLKDLTAEQRSILAKGLEMTMQVDDAAVVKFDFQFGVVAHWKGKRFETLIARPSFKR